VDLTFVNDLVSQATSPTTAQEYGRKAGKAIALGIESVTRQPEMRDEITSIQWLGFALTEAIVFYAFIFGLIAFFLG
jgi:F-type H+-transporting ATPase subunit c